MERARLRAPDAQLYLNRILMPLCEVFPDSGLYSRALSIAYDAKLSFHDALVVASAIAGECRILWTEDLQHGRRIDTLEIRN
jgi:predicted nucleic acid-binding protein